MVGWKREGDRERKEKMNGMEERRRAAKRWREGAERAPEDG